MMNSKFLNVSLAIYCLLVIVVCTIIFQTESKWVGVGFAVATFIALNILLRSQTRNDTGRRTGTSAHKSTSSLILFALIVSRVAISVLPDNFFAWIGPMIISSVIIIIALQKTTSFANQRLFISRHFYIIFLVGLIYIRLHYLMTKELELPLTHVPVGILEAVNFYLLIFAINRFSNVKNQNFILVLTGVVFLTIGSAVFPLAQFSEHQYPDAKSVFLVENILYYLGVGFITFGLIDQIQTKLETHKFFSRQKVEFPFESPK